MANFGPRVPSAAHPLGTKKPQDHTGTIPSLDQLIQSWEPDILRAAKARGMGYDATEDLVQAARIRLAQALVGNHHHPDRYLRRVITNAMHDEFRGKRVIDDPDLVVRADGGGPDAAEEQEVRDENPLACDSFFDDQEIRRWVSTLSTREQRIADLVLVRDVSERAAAAILGISKTRLHQLKEGIIRRARNDLIALAV
jgi:RNA polymerase sigma factor (sigma-70 family)